MKRGIVLTIDAMVALIVAAAFIAAIMYFVTEPGLKTDEYLYNVGGDFLAVADKGGGIVAAMDGDPSRLSEFMDAIPDNICLNLTVTNVSGSVLLRRDNGCQGPAKYVIAKRTVVNNTRNYVCGVKAWYR
jgi:hypothetical protein